MSDRRFIDDLIQASNDYRAVHQAEPLKYSAVISAISQRWADRLAQTGVMQHNPDRTFNGQPLGENIAMKWSSDDRDYSGKEATDQWYNEIVQYDFKRHSGPGTGHFTQLVWKASREIGVGRAQSRDKKWFVVANYFPAGNYVGENPENVLPALGRGSASAAAKQSSILRMSPSSPASGSSSAAEAAVRSKPSTTPMSVVPAPKSTTVLIPPSRLASQSGVMIERKQETRLLLLRFCYCHESDLKSAIEPTHKPTRQPHSTTVLQGGASVLQPRSGLTNCDVYRSTKGFFLHYNAHNGIRSSNQGKRFIDWSKSRLFSCRTKNGTKTITVTETFRDADGPSENCYH